MTRTIPSPALARVEKGQLCTGCGLCAAIAPAAVTMAMVAPGYLRPQQSATLTAAQDAEIAAACPGLVIDESDHPPAPFVDPLWGPVHHVGTGHAIDAALRHQASSGGVISALLVHAISTGLVDYVVQTGADPDMPTGNQTRVSTSETDIFAAAGSRYTASAPLAGLEGWLARPGRFACVGKPCDVSALRARARHDPRINAKVPVMLAFFCAGIPSAAGTRHILDRMGVDPDDVTAFRYRGDGWPGFAKATLTDGSTREMSYADSWGGILSKEVQFRCKICPDATGNVADVACADAWEGDKRGYPSFAEQAGRSLVIARTAAGAALVAEARVAERIFTTPLETAAIGAMQPAQARRKKLILSRLAALILTGRPWPRYRGLRLWAAAVRDNPVAQARSFAGLVRRLVQGRA
ncbi:MAG: Coenzyme F420 hydrogenase/dehydrogenase, beta subunit C-terminal domain [Polymorphobacter sp.]